MTDTKLNPATLSAEERAFVDLLAAQRRRDGFPDDKCHEYAFEDARCMILARRALFAPATEKAVCPNCGEEATYPHGFKWDGEDHYRCSKPAQPEPAAPEMPEAVKNALGRLAYCASCPHETDRWMEETLEIRTVLESWWRTHSTAQPVAVGMTGELTDLLGAVDAIVSLTPGWSIDNETRVLLAHLTKIVRQQAAQGPKVELPKVREAINAMGRMAYGEPFAQSILKRLENAALAELDTAEGRK